MKKNKGITLIALVVTIIVLIILAAVSLNMLLGQNGIISKAQEAAKGTKVESGRELIAMAAMASYDDTGRLNKTDLATELNKIPGIVQGDSYIYPIPGFPLDVVLDGTTYQIKGDGKVTGGESTGGTVTPTDEKIADLFKADNTGEIKIADYVEYIPTSDTFDWSATENGATYATYSGSSSNTNFSTQDSLNWRVLDITDSGEIRLISDLPTTDIVFLSGYNGYNNAVYLLDKICNKLYSKDGVSEKVQSLKIEDIEKYTTYDYTQYSNSYIDTGKYGGTKEYLTSDYSGRYPSIFATETSGWVDNIKGTLYAKSEQDTLINQTAVKAAGETIKITQTWWGNMLLNYNFKDYSTNNNAYYKLFMYNGANLTYWLSSRATSAGNASATFAVYYISNPSVMGQSLYSSSNIGDYNALKIRPVVTLNSNVQVDMANKPTGDTSSTNCWKLK